MYELVTQTARCGQEFYWEVPPPVTQYTRMNALQALADRVATHEGGCPECIRRKAAEELALQALFSCSA